MFGIVSAVTFVVNWEKSGGQFLISPHILIRGGFIQSITTRAEIFSIYAIFHVQFNGVVQMFNFLRAIITKKNLKMELYFDSL